eukprot:COSAG06_NODE_40747_length_399_cov_0.623333_1_plen_46_part_01
MVGVSMSVNTAPGQNPGKPVQKVYQSDPKRAAQIKWSRTIGCDDRK